MRGALAMGNLRGWGAAHNQHGPEHCTASAGGGGEDKEAEVHPPLQHPAVSRACCLPVWALLVVTGVCAPQSALWARTGGLLGATNPPPRRSALCAGHICRLGFLTAGAQHPLTLMGTRGSGMADADTTVRKSLLQEEWEWLG